MQEMKITDDICSIGCQFMWEGFAEAMNPKITSTCSRPSRGGTRFASGLLNSKHEIGNEDSEIVYMKDLTENIHGKNGNASGLLITAHSIPILVVMDISSRNR